MHKIRQHHYQLQEIKRKVGWDDCERDARQLLEALLSLANEELELGDAHLKKAVQTEWLSETELRVTGTTREGKRQRQGTTLEYLAKLTELAKQEGKCRSSLTKNQVQNVIYCLKALAIFEGGPIMSNSKFWKFTLKLKSTDKEANLNWLFDPQREWKRRKEEWDRLYKKPEGSKQSEASEIAPPNWSKVCRTQFKKQQWQLYQEDNIGTREVRRLPLYEQYAGLEVADRLEEMFQDYTTLFVGRENALVQLDDFLTQSRNSWLLITAPAGFGKTALLVNWVLSLLGTGCFIAYHFFSYRYDVTRPVASAYRNLLRQLYIYYELSDEPLPNDENQLRETLYGIVRERGARETEPLVIVLDALDEADHPFSPPFPTPLPENVFVIASARAEEGEEPEYLRGWTDRAKPIHLNRLPCVAITDWLRRTGEGELGAFAEDAHFVAQVDETTEGFPLYLSYLTEELSHVAKQGQDVREVLAKTPKGFERYVEQQLKRLEELELPEQRWQFFALLAVAKGALSQQDVKALTGMRDRELRQLRQSWQVMRWIQIVKQADVTLYAFAHPLLGTTFADQLGDDAENALQALLDYCASWQEHQSRYVLRYYAEHLRQIKRWGELFAIARDEAFASAQQEHLPDDPDLPLKTVQTALLSAAETDDVVAIAKFLLLHARRLLQTTSQDLPLEALRAGSLNRALALADLYDIERCVLWYLLLAWELKDTERLDEAQATLEKLRKKKLVRGFSLSVGTDDTRASYVEYAAYLLAYVSDISRDVFKDLTQRLLYGYQQVPLCQTLSARGDFIIALEAALLIDDGSHKVKALTDIAATQAQAGDRTAVQNTLNFILETAQAADDKWSWIAAAQAKAGNFDAALKAAQKIDKKEKQAWALGEIATAQAQVGHRETARANLAIALDTAQKIDNKWKKAKALQGVAIAQAEVGEFTDALETAKETGWECTRGNVLNSIVKVYARAGNFDAALKIVRGMVIEKPNDQLAHSHALEPIAEALAQTGNFNAALCVVANMAINQARAIGVIAATMAQLGARHLARHTFALVLKTTTWIKPPQQKQPEALGAIAQVQAELGQRNEARATFTTALEVAQKINDKGAKDWALQTISEAQVQSGELTAALKTAQMIVDRGRRLTILPLIAIAHGQVGDKDTARTIFTDALEIARKVDDESVREAELRDIAKRQAQIGDFAAALETARENGREFTRPQVLGVIAQVEAQDGNTEAARATFTAALEAARKLGNSWDRSWTLRTISKAQAQSEEFSAALETAREIDNERERVEAMQEIAKAQIQSEQFTDALETTREIKAQGQQAVEVLVIVAEAKAKAEGREAAQVTYATALNLVQGIMNDGIQAILLETIAKSQAKTNFGSQAIRTMDMVLINRNKNLPSVGAVLAETGDKENFKRLLIPCANYLDAAFEMCGFLARLYPEQAVAIAKVVNELR